MPDFFFANVLDVLSPVPEILRDLAVRVTRSAAVTTNAGSFAVTTRIGSVAGAVLALAVAYVKRPFHYMDRIFRPWCRPHQGVTVFRNAGDVWLAAVGGDRRC